MHVAPVQFRDPAVTVPYDSDPAEAGAGRAKIYADAAREGYCIGAAHAVAKDGHFLWAAPIKTD